MRVQASGRQCRTYSAFYRLLDPINGIWIVAVATKWLIALMYQMNRLIHIHLTFF